MPTTFGFTNVNDMTFSAYACIQDLYKGGINSCNSLTLDGNGNRDHTNRTARVNISDISNAYAKVANSTDTGDGSYPANIQCALYDLSMAYNQIHAKINDASLNQVTDQQNTLDSELAEILTYKNIYSESQHRVESAVLSGILWTTLAVTLVYFVFRKL